MRTTNAITAAQPGAIRAPSLAAPKTTKSPSHSLCGAVMLNRPPTPNLDNNPSCFAALSLLLRSSALSPSAPGKNRLPVTAHQLNERMNIIDAEHAIAGQVRR